ncbi:phage regulatory CII family protein [Glaciecola siphonariae]|uniref:Phage regulatory CII family protein n=1 Tax=Glaciecola siphonariae TaxID=521012 RepID=A0ABV9LU39_9ALTE
MKTKNTFIEIKDSHCLEDAMRSFSKYQRLDILAPKIGCSPNVLRNKLNPDQEFHKLTALEVILLTHITGDETLLSAMGRMIGFTMYRPATEKSAISDLMHGVLKTQGAAGHICDIYQQAIEDKVITSNERDELLEAINKAQRHLSELASGLNSYKVHG